MEAPTGMTISAPAASAGEFIVTLSYPWPESGSSQDDYTLEESTPISEFVEIATSPDGAWHQTFSFPLGRPTGTYFYRGRAWVNATPSPYSSVATVVVASTDIVHTFYASYTNLLMYSPTNAAIANTLDTISDLSVGSNYYFGTTGDFEYTHSGSFLKFDVQSIIALKTILEAKLILYPVSLPKDSSGQYKVSATVQEWYHPAIFWRTWYFFANVYPDSTGDFVAPRTPGIPLQIDVTEIVKHWANGTWGAHGLVLLEPNLHPPDPPFESYRAVTFENLYSYTNPLRRPQLFVRYQ